MIKALIKKVANTFGYDIIRLRNNLPNKMLHSGKTMQNGLVRAQNLFSKINCVIDIGAAAGTWTEKAMKQWPNAQYLLIEPLIERKDELDVLKAKYQNLEFILAVAGDRTSKVEFSVASDLDGSGVYGDSAKNTTSREIKQVAIDDIVKKYDQKGPYLLKLDTHGYEIPIFEGAKETLKNTNLIIVEVYGFFVSPHAVLFYDLCKYLEEVGFRPLDVVDVVNRRKDGAFWQCDIFFAPKSNPVFKDNAYA